jgi:hypothetical protein
MRFEDFEHFRVHTDVLPPALTHDEPCSTSLVGEIGHRPSVATLMRFADQHRVYCQYGFSEPEATAEANARWETVWLLYPDGTDTFAFLTRQKGSELWDVTLAVGGPDANLSGDGVGYEQALVLVFRAMGEQMPHEFIVTRR